ncbi:hypothetical protein [Chromobacterium haemolyticum]|uniref:hypothetical protein n=1 Tax=Chromobacterium haemolyticum TaxID=394935 RepID=UPI0013175780|nr:hypothetical protein [Chromobacterium haemolyticum]BBH12951.1 hypothetical protein CH06BL_21990 [Chromobacterium haemolyticum]
MSDIARGLAISRRIDILTGASSPVNHVVRELVRHYQNVDVRHIPSYELEKIFDRLSLPKSDNWKELIDLICFDLKLAELKFHLVDGDSDFDLNFDDIQMVMQGHPILVNHTFYSPAAAREKIFTYLVPNKRFRYLLCAKRACDE